VSEQPATVDPDAENCQNWFTLLSKKADLQVELIDYFSKTKAVKVFIIFLLHTRVARWFVFKPKIPIWVKFTQIGILEGPRVENV
jgi:hypothetical protein